MSQYKDYGFPSECPPHTHLYLSENIKKLLPGDNSGSILDVGCGNGSLVRYLLENGFDAYGTDASIQGIEIAEKLNKGRFALQDLASDELPMEFNSLSIKTIISTEVIEHLYNPKLFISFIKTILLKNGGGTVIISTPYHGYLKNLMISLLGNWDSHASPLWDGGHIKLWSRSTLTTLLEENGFIVKKFVGCGRIPYLWKSMIIKAEIHA